MKHIDQIVKKLDTIQQRHPTLSFPYAVFKKYSEDDTSSQGALITYYGFLSLFPLLLVTTSVIDILSSGNASLHVKVMKSIGSYFPIIGEQLERNIHSSNKSGIALVVGLVITLYGARGGADAFRGALNHIWQIPKSQRVGFPNGLFKSLSIIIVGGSGLIIAAVLSAYASGLGHLFVFKILSVLVSFLLLVATFYFLLSTGVTRRDITRKDTLVGAVLSGFGILIMQALGGYIVANQLRSLSSLYGTFAVVLGLLFWIYLQVEIVLYAVEISTVLKYKLWPRSLRDVKRA